jgi:hypothetical protein
MPSPRSLRRAAPALALLAALPMTAHAQSKTPVVQVTPHEADHRVEVTVDGKPFTSFLYPTDLPKQVLYPLRTADGKVVTRGWPLDPRPGERVDHPHHIGLWFNHSDVNGLDFWNNSEAIPAAQKDRMGTILFKGIRKVESGAGQGALEVSSDWVTPKGKTLLHETTRYVFRAGPNLRSVDRITTLTAADTTVTFHDNKDGTLGLRVRRELEQPSDQPEVFTDGSGRATAVPVLNNAGVTGRYRNAEGVEGDDVWSTRSRWTELTGTVEGEPVTVAILDHPSNYNFPTYWHARGYGLFAANPLGAKDFTKGQKVDDFTLKPGQSTTFRYRVLILNGPTTPEGIEQRYQEWAK